MGLGDFVDPKPTITPVPITLHGKSLTLVPLQPSLHAATLHSLFTDDTFTYLGIGPFATAKELEDAFTSMDMPVKFAIIPKTTPTVPVTVTDGKTGEQRELPLPRQGDPLGILTLMRFKPADRVIEVGAVLFSAYMQRSTMSTEAVFLVIKHACEGLNCRRVEWKCHAGNAASERAALRLGYTYEGKFRNHMISKGRNRDSLWFSIIEEEWEGIKKAFETWLADENFVDGRQKRKLEDIRKEILGEKEEWK